MLCPQCSTDMFIDRTEPYAEGDTSPDTVTEMFSVPYFKCVNPACPAYNRMLKGEKIPLASGKSDDTEGYIISCCDRVLLTQIGGDIKIPKGVHHTTDGETFTLTCPVCGTVKKYRVVV